MKIDGLVSVAHGNLRAAKADFETRPNQSINHFLSARDRINEALILLGYDNALMRLMDMSASKIYTLENELERLKDGIDNA